MKLEKVKKILVPVEKQPSWWDAIYLLEALLVIAGVLVVGGILNPRDMVYFQLTPHPFLFATIFLALRYGLKAGFFSSLILSAAYLAGGGIQGHWEGNWHSYVQMSTPLQMILMGSVLGEIREQQKQRFLWKSSQFDKVSQELKELKESYRALEEVRHLLEKRIASENTGFRILEKIFHHWKDCRPSDLPERFMETLARRLEGGRIAIYRFHNSRARVVRKKGERIPREMSQKVLVSDPLVEKGNEEGEFMSPLDLDEDEESEWAFYAPLCDGEGQRWGFVLIGDMPLMWFNYRNLHLLRLLTTWFCHFMEGSWEKFQEGEK